MMTVRAWRLLALALAGAAALAAGPGRAAVEADAPIIERVERYLNDISTLRAQFVQIAHDGATSRGTLYIKRPGRLRLDYEPPADIVLVSDGEWLTFKDRAAGQISQTPLAGTPAALLVGKNIRLDGNVAVTDIVRGRGVLRVTLTRVDSSSEGSMTLVFTEEPFALRQWVVVDPQGLATRVTLFDIERGVELDPSLFAAPAPFPGRDRR